MHVIWKEVKANGYSCGGGPLVAPLNTCMREDGYVSIKWDRIRTPRTPPPLTSVSGWSSDWNPNFSHVSDSSRDSFSIASIITCLRICKVSLHKTLFYEYISLASARISRRYKPTGIFGLLRVFYIVLFKSSRF